MDRNVVIATILIVLILFVWMYFLSPPPPPVEESVAADTMQMVEPSAEPAADPGPDALTAVQAVPVVVGDSAIARAQAGEERFITVETDLYEARFSTRGATLVSFQLKAYKKFDQTTPVQLVDTTVGGAVGLTFFTPSGARLDTRTVFFEPSIDGDRLDVPEDGAALSFEAALGQGTIRQTYTFTPGDYEVGLTVVQQNATSFQTADGYELSWYGAMPFSESPEGRKDEVTKVGAYARSGGEVEGILTTELSEETAADNEKMFRGEVSWVAVKNKYFAAVVIPPAGTAREAELVGERDGEIDDPGVRAAFRASLLMPLPSGGEGDAYRLYLGPLRLSRIADYNLGLYDMVDYGWDAFEWMTRPLAKFVFIPAFGVLSSFIPNYGVVIIVFAFLIKLVVFPLTKSSYRSMARMRELQPKMQEIKEKFPDNPQKQQEATMKLYRESGVNPLGGCLPMLLQYPILIALWMFLQQSIEIRQQGFLWAHDLSAPDAILHLPFTIPLYGDFVAGFTLLMGLSMIVQMRVQSTPAAGPQAKIMMYLMPGVIFVIFNSFPSGVSLYYLCYNVITAIQQKWINKSIEDEKDQDGADGKGGKKSAKASGASKNGRQRKGDQVKKGKSKKEGRQVRS